MLDTRSKGGPGSCQCDLDDTTKCIRDGNQITEAHTDIGSSEGIAPLPETSGEQNLNHEASWNRLDLSSSHGSVNLFPNSTP